MDTKKPLTDLAQCAKQAAAAAPMKVLGFVGTVLEAQKKVVEFELGLLEDALRIVKSLSRPPAASGS